MVVVYINDLRINVSNKVTVFQACQEAGFEVSRFCYHDRLIVSGNCRMCLVEIIGIPKPVASCAMPVIENMRIYTNSPLVRKARENIIEFLLLNHPLDCPICDQGGECDLQDQSYIWGSDRGRFFFSKNSLTNKNFGPLVKSVISRCISCTRCVRFIGEVVGFGFLGVLGRGSNVEISNYIPEGISSFISGNLIDLCPVGFINNCKY
mmetsp:Transcript_5415/g.12080  ORF Transcript_5415/g.12080 Transcript_5415/m.12080 type:complete len:207 (+) Transcript_5415:234-854(+)